MNTCQISAVVLNCEVIFPKTGIQLPPPIKDFLHQYDLNGKTVIPFKTRGGYGTGSSFEQVSELCSDCNVLEGFSIKGGMERDGVYLAIKGDKAREAEIKVTQWLRRIEVLE